jgi:hypothetical protein
MGQRVKTLAVFDNTLPVSTRFWSLVSSLSINTLLPSVNGVMLGFGEIFAKSIIVGWLESPWSRPTWDLASPHGTDSGEIIGRRRSCNARGR